MRPVRLFERESIRYPLQRAATPSRAGGEMLYPPSRHSISISALPSSTLDLMPMSRTDGRRRDLLSKRPRTYPPPLSAVKAHRESQKRHYREADPAITPLSLSTGPGLDASIRKPGSRLRITPPVPRAGGCSNKRARRQDRQTRVMDEPREMHLYRSSGPASHSSTMMPPCLAASCSRLSNVQHAVADGMDAAAGRGSNKGASFGRPLPAD